MYNKGQGTQEGAEAGGAHKNQEGGRVQKGGGRCGSRGEGGERIRARRGVWMGGGGEGGAASPLPSRSLLAAAGGARALVRADSGKQLLLQHSSQLRVAARQGLLAL